MKKYFVLQLKRAARFLPGALCGVLVLFGCMSLLLGSITGGQTGDAKIRVGIVSATENSYLKWGLAAMQFDSSAMSLKPVLMEEAEAARALERGQIAAYVVFPEEFIENAMAGQVGQLRLVSTLGATGLVSIFKEEVTVLVGKILSACEKGAYGAGAAVAAGGLPQEYGHYVNEMSLEYLDLLFDRSRMYRVETLAQDSLPLPQYMLGGLSVLLLMLCCLIFAPLYIRRDDSLEKLLLARRIGPVRQTAGEFLAYFAALLVLLAAVSAVLRGSGLLPAAVSFGRIFAGALPTLLLAAALSFCLYGLSGQLVGGMLLSFFTVLVLGFAGGCMYPVQVFPQSLQRLAAVLPSGLARRSLTACLLGQGSVAVPALLAWSGAFLAAAVGLRSRRIRRAGR